MPSTRLSYVLLTAAAGLIVGDCCHAQTAVQLPTFRSFRTSGAVMVPDRGGASLGSIRRSRSGQTSFGTPLVGRAPLAGRAFGNRAIGSAAAAGGVSTHVTITDHREMDRALLAEAARRQGNTHDILGRPVGPATSTSRVVDPRRSSLAPNPTALWQPRRSGVR